MKTGYHIIYGLNSGKFETEFIETEDELMKLPITKESIIFNGLKEWGPVRIGDSSIFKNTTEDWYKAGRKAEILFYQQASEKYIVEQINQDQISYESYNKQLQGRKIKRGDFLIRDVYNLEIEVKSCEIQNGYFILCAKHHYAHKEMQNRSEIPVVFAIYERKGAEIVSDFPRMISNYKIEELRNEKLLRYTQKNGSKLYKIPVDHTTEGFELIEHFRRVIRVSVD